MPQVKQAGEFNTFVGGLVTEASPLTFPENASIDEENFVLNRDGSRRRRLGMDREDGLTPYSVTYGTTPVDPPAISTFEWNDVAGIAGKTFIVCQIHDKAYVFDRSDETLKSQSYAKYTFSLSADTISQASFTSIDGSLVVAYGKNYVLQVKYLPDIDGFQNLVRKISIRDLFGVGYPSTDVDLASPDKLNQRPASFVTTAAEEAHMYNLRNQGWALPRLQWTGNVKADPVLDFEDSGGDERGLPSNADIPTLTVYANTAETDKNSERFNDEAAYRQEPVRARAPMGHFIIDLFSRGSSRKSVYEDVTSTIAGIYTNANPGLTPEYVTFRTPTLTELPDDRADDGVRLVTEFAGRVWYGGFTSSITDGDAQSPALSSYIFYSQQVKHDSQIGHCYQEGDPTSADTPDRLDTDGGFIRLSGAYNVQKMVNIGSGLMVLAENGVWFVRGSDTGAFNANNQSVDKISERGTLSPGSVVVVDNTIMYWPLEPRPVV